MNRNLQSKIKSIVAEINESESTSDDDYTRQQSCDLLTNTVAVIPPFNQQRYDTRLQSHNNNYLSTENTSQEFTMFPNASTQIQRKQRGNTLNFNRAPSPNIFDRRNQFPPKPIVASQSRSYEDLSIHSLRKKLTNDSGTGESIIIPADAPYSTPTSYDIVRVFGQKNTVLMRNRYEFDQSKVDQYVNRKIKHPKPPIIKPKKIADNPNGKKGVLSGLPKKFSKSSLNTEFPYSPIVRHHSSSDHTND
ncbi:unnamed protein product [Rotaria socialis]|uniref:Uncharacterized protein n=1 Tax=Rotaria socialis TaxID=392032 RepID=A0A817U8W4_9BILA|nr:unnamed protein product [Rotaria socialis]CAF4268708.1 unnamed protein product [Rotaria socialis]